MLKDDSTLRDIKLTKGAKVMVVGSTIQDVLTVAPPDPEATKSSVATTSKELFTGFCKIEYDLVNIYLLIMCITTSLCLH